MNKLSGYKEFTLADGSTIELKFCNGTTEIFADLMGLETAEEVEAMLLPDIAMEGDVQVVKTPIKYLRAIRLFVYSAAKYAALAQNKPVTFNDLVVSEWIEELGLDAILAVMEKTAPAKEDKKKLSKTIRATQ